MKNTTNNYEFKMEVYGYINRCYIQDTDDEPGEYSLCIGSKEILVFEDESNNPCLFFNRLTSYAQGWDIEEWEKDIPAYYEDDEIGYNDFDGWTVRIYHDNYLIGEYYIKGYNRKIEILR